MRRNKRQDNDHTDESEVFKKKSLMAAKNRKRMSKIVFAVMCLLAAFVVAACMLSYFFQLCLTCKRLEATLQLPPGPCLETRKARKALTDAFRAFYIRL